MVSLQILGFSGACCLRYVLDVSGFPGILGLVFACCSLCVGCFWFPYKF
jgi:hypothetical protein